MKRLIAATIAIILSACGPREKHSEDAFNADEAAAEAAMQAVAGVIDEQEGLSFAALRTESMSRYEMLAQLLMPQAVASSACSRAVFQACNTGVRSIQYSDCDVPSTNFSMNGSVALTYSSSSCSMTNTNDLVVRTYDYTVSGPRGGSVHNFSSARNSSVDGTSIGGGGRLTRMAGGWDIDILGKHKVATLPRGRTHL